MIKKNLVDSFPVFVEFNPTYKLLFVSCLLDQKKMFFYEKRYIPWLDENNWERNQTVVLAVKRKKRDGRAKTQNPLFVSCWSVFNCSRPNICGMKILKDMFGRMHPELTVINKLTKQKKREKFNKPTTQESSSPSGGECEICAIVFFSIKVY